MENQNGESATAQPHKIIDSLSQELQPIPSCQQSEKRHRPEESPPLLGIRLKRVKDTKPSPPPILPQEIIVEILANLPVVSLLRFRCVSKSWNSLIDDPFFIKKHLKITQNDPKFTRKRVLINTANIQIQTRTRYSIKSCSLSALYQDHIANPTEIEYPSEKGSDYNWIVGSCNGLVCIAIRQDTVFLLNPTLKVFKKLLDLGFKRRRGCFTVYGFGFDASVDDYKVVRVFCYQRKDFQDRYESIVRVYSLRTNCWRRIQDFPFGVPCDEAGKYVDGSLNWPVFHRQGTYSSCTIVSLDLSQETYKEVPQPGYGLNAPDYLGVLDGCLFLLYDHWKEYIDLWIMREYGKRESWTNLARVPYILDFGFQMYSTPLFVSASGEILLHFGEKLILYNPKENTSRILVIQDAAVSYIDQAEIYVESLVLPTRVNWQ